MALTLFSITAKRRKEIFTVIHGHCPTGADWIADEWVDWMMGFDYPIDRKRYPADWKQYGKPAGHIRNKQMIDENHADLYAVLAFPLGKSPGTRGCMKYAERMGLMVINLGDE